MKKALPRKYAEILSKPYLDPSYFMIRCQKCKAVVDKRSHKCNSK